jgi:acyl transferase domain-containing protein
VITINATINVNLNLPSGAVRQVTERLDSIMATQIELATSLATVTAQVTKIGDETRTLLTKIADLTAAVAAAGTTTPEVDAALTALQDQVGVVDALVPDAAPPEVPADPV